MDDSSVPRIANWGKIVFFMGDALLLLVALGVVIEAPHPITLPFAVLLVVSVLAGAVLSVIPFVLEYKASVQLAEVDELRSAAGQFQNLDEFCQQIRMATSQWQTVQEHCLKAVDSAQAIGDRMIAEGKSFAEFMQKADDSERTHLKLEIEKLRRAENDWLEVVVRICDHVFALQRAGARSGQPALAEQLSLFQRAVRDATRRIGLTPTEAQENEKFDERAHQLADSQASAPPGALIAETVATGYSMQGQTVRRVVVALKDGETPVEAS